MTSAPHQRVNLCLRSHGQRRTRNSVEIPSDRAQCRHGEGNLCDDVAKTEALLPLVFLLSADTGRKIKPVFAVGIKPSQRFLTLVYHSALKPPGSTLMRTQQLHIAASTRFLFSSASVLVRQTFGSPVVPFITPHARLCARERATVLAPVSAHSPRRALSVSLKLENKKKKKTTTYSACSRSFTSEDLEEPEKLLG